MGDQHALSPRPLEDGGFVDGAASDVTLRVLAYNAASGQAGLWALLRVRFRFGAHDESDVDAARAAAARGRAGRARRSRAARGSSKGGASRCSRCGRCAARRPRAGSRSSCCCYC